MRLIHMLHSGTISVVIKFQKASLRLILWKQISQNCIITWLAWQDHNDVSLAAHMHFTVLSAYSITTTTVANSEAVSSQITL